MNHIDLFKNQKPVAPLFFDAEFSGLDPDENEITEIGWILDVDGKTVSYQNWLVEHHTKPSEWVLKNTDYKERILKPKNAGLIIPELDEALNALTEDIVKLVPCDYDVHLVGASPWYDMEYLRRAYKKYSLIQPFHWRAITIETLFQGYLLGKGVQLNAPTSTAKMMKYFGLIESDNEHSTESDNIEVRSIYYRILND